MKLHNAIVLAATGLGVGGTLIAGTLSPHHAHTHSVNESHRSEAEGCYTPAQLASLIDSPLFKSTYTKYYGLIKEQQKLAAENLKKGVVTPPPVQLFTTCYADDTPPEVVAAHHQAMIAAGAWPSTRSGQDYNAGARWSGTNGTPRALTWSLVPDGTNFDGYSSDLFAQMDAKFAAAGGRAKWISLLTESFNRWAQLTGVSYTRVTAAGVDWDSGGTAGSAGGGASATRGDVRIGGANYDGASNVLAYNYFPSNGDMLLDTSENWASSGSNYRFLRNVVQHEHGHGLGYNHVCPIAQTKLMEPFYSAAFEGVRHDDARAGQWQYGDDNEPNGTSPTATDLGAVAVPSTTSVGTNVTDPAAPAGATYANITKTSVGPSSDLDWYKFTVSAAANVAITLTPVGLSYLEGDQNSNGSCQAGSNLNSLAIGTLQGTVYSTNGTTVLGSGVAGSAGTSAVINATLPGAGTYFFRANATAALTEAQSYSFSLATTAAGGNLPPTITGSSTAAVNELAPLTLNYSATDPNAGQTITWSLTGAPAGMTISSSGVLSWTPTEAQGPNTYNVTVVATDNGSPAESGTLPLTVTVNEVNAAPTITNGGDATIPEGTLYQFDFNASDSDIPANTLVFSLVGAPSGAVINATTGVFSWIPTEAQGTGGAYNFTVRVTDNGPGALTADKAIALTVSEVNVAPVLTTPTSASGNEGTAITFNATATDSDLPAQTLTFSLVSPPAGATINPTTGAFSWTPSESQGPAVTNITVRVTDNGPGALSADKVVPVTVNEVNNAPVLTVPSSVSGDEGTLITFTASATDSDLPANGITYLLTGVPPTASINPTTGVFTWTPSEAEGPGVYVATIRALDNGSPAKDDIETVTITVNEANRPPVFNGIGAQTVTDGNTLTFTTNATDPDVPVQTLTYNMVSGPSGATFNAATREFSWTPTATDAPGAYSATFSVSDGSLTGEIIVPITLNVTNKTLSGSMSVVEFVGPIESRTFSYQVYDGSSTLAMGTFNTDNTGAFSLSMGSVFVGSYTIYIDGVGALKKNLGSAAITPSGLNVGLVILTNGDINDDGSVDLLDYFALSDAYNTVLGDPTYNPAADLNGDESVDLLDYFILSDSYNLTDDE